MDEIENLSLTMDDLWAGTQSSLLTFLERQANVAEKMQAWVNNGGATSGGGSEQSAPVPYLLSIQDGVGVISIKGPMSNTASFWDRYDGATSYPAIREALVYAANSPEVKQVLLDVQSGGGQVAGLSDTADLISKVDQNFKPVYTHTSSTMASAALWLGVSGREVYGSKNAEIGSLGVMAMHADRSESLKRQGINVTVMRSGEFKALGNGMEPLSDVGKAHMQASLDSMYKVFAGHVAEARDKSYEYTDKHMGQGRMFGAVAANEVGLTDGVASYDEVFAHIKNLDSQVNIDKSKGFAENNGKQEGITSMTHKIALTEQSIAALAAGAPAAKSPEEIAADAAAATAAIAAAASTAALEGAVEGAALASAAAIASNPDATVALLQSQLATKDEALIDAKVALKSAQAAITELQAAQAPLMSIAGKSIANMQIALGAAAVSIEGRSATEVVAEHDRLRATFETQFKAGGVAATDATKEVVRAVADSNHLARIAATLPKSKGA